MQRLSSGFKVFSGIFHCLMTGLIDASVSGISGQYSSDSANISPTKYSKRKSTCQFSHPNLVVIDHVTTQYTYVKKEGRFSQADIGLAKKQGIRNILVVKGSIHAEEMMVATEAPDLVFAPLYDLQSFEFVDDFTAENHPQPGIPLRVSVETVGGRSSIGTS